MSIIEKAFAKVCGCYQALDAGHSIEAMSMLSGQPCETLFLQVSKISHNREETFDPDMLWAKYICCHNCKVISLTKFLI